MSIANTVVSSLLRSPLHRLLSGSTDLVRYTGRRSGREISTPTQYARRGEDVIILVGQPRNKTWWRNFTSSGGDIDVLMQRRWVPMTARAVVGADEPETIGPLLNAYLARFPRAKRALGGERDKAPAEDVVIVWCQPRQTTDSMGEAVDASMSEARLPPRWFMRFFWFAHRRVVRLTGRRLGLWRPKANGWGAMRLTTVGRRTGRERSVMVGYFEDGPNLVTMAMNGWGEGEPAWWLNLQTNPLAHVDIADETRRQVTCRAAGGEERERLWSRWRAIDKDLDALAARRSTETAVVVMEPLP